LLIVYVVNELKGRRRKGKCKIEEKEYGEVMVVYIEVWSKIHCGRQWERW